MLDWIGGAAAFRGQTDDEEEEEQDEEEGGLDSTAGWSEHGVFSTGGADKSNAERDAGDGAGDAPQTASWRAWGSSALRAVAQLDAAGVARIARSTLEVVHRDVSEFTQAVAEDARDLATVGSTVVLPELKATAQGLKASLAGVVPGTLEEASSALLANLASVRDTILSENDANVVPARRARAEGGAQRGRGDARGRPSLAARVSAMQRDSATYCSQPSDGAAFDSFMASFTLEGRAADVAAILGGNAFMSELHSRIVPVVVDDRTFWARYFFHLQQLTQQEQEHEAEQEAGSPAVSAEQPPNAGTSSNTPLVAAQDTDGTESSGPEAAPFTTAGAAADSPADEGDKSPVEAAELSAKPPPVDASTAAGDVDGGDAGDDEGNSSSAWTEVEAPSMEANDEPQSPTTTSMPPPAASREKEQKGESADSPAPVSQHQPVADAEPATPVAAAGGPQERPAEVDSTPSPSPWPKGAPAAGAAPTDDEFDEDWGLN